MLSNTSGSGKTRFCLELLSRRLGFFFTYFADTHVSPYGPIDFTMFLSDPSYLRSDSGDFVHSHIFRPSSSPGREVTPDIANQRNVNRQIIEKIILAALLTRLLVFDHFLTVAAPFNLTPTQLASKWLILQLRPQQLMKTDIFHSIMARVNMETMDTINTALAFLLNKHAHLAPLVVIDEAQIGCDPGLGAFGLDNGMPCGSIKQLVATIGTCLPSSPIIISGTSLDPSAISEGIALSASSIRNLSSFCDFGAFDHRDQVDRYVRHFLGRDVAPWEIDQLHFWLRGR